MSHLLEINSFEDLVENLELAHEFLCRTQSDQRYWKWFIQALYSSAQGAAALALEKGNGFLIQKSKVTRKMLAAHDAKSEPVDPFMDNFLELVRKSLVRRNLRSSALPLEDLGHLAALNLINEWRNQFVHFNQSWGSIELVALLKNASLVVLYIEHYAIRTPAIHWGEESHQQRSAVAIENLRTQIARRTEFLNEAPIAFGA